MAVLTYSEMSTLAMKRIQGDVANDPPFTAADILVHMNEAYADVWQASGAAFAAVQGATIWSTNQPTTGGANVCQSTLASIEEILHVWAADNNTDVPGTPDWNELERVDLATIFARGATSGIGTYSTPKVYAIARKVQAAGATTNLFTLYFWPYVAGFYFPTIYAQQFVPLDGTAGHSPNVNDLESRDIAILAAARMAPLAGRAEFVPSILMDVSERTRAGLERRQAALMDAKQDK